MVLPFLVALLTALGPLLRGSWDLWAQSILHAATILGFCLWLSVRIFIGHIPLPSFRTLIWVGSLAALSAVSAYWSPVPGLAKPEWWNLLNALWIFPAMAALSKDQRSWIDEAIRICAWILMLLAFYQHISLGDSRPASALLNENIYAGALLMFLPLALEKQDLLLAAGLLWNLIWTHSLGAWLGLSAALVLTQKKISPARFWLGAGVALICAVILYGKLGSPEGLHRWWWWKAAAAMAAEHPIFGMGPGSFGYLLPAFLSKFPGGLFSLYAHNYPLQTAAEFGIPFCVIWLAGLWHCIGRNSSHKRFGVIAVGIHSLWDYTLSLPANLWLFSYFAASSIPDSSEGVNIPSRYKMPLILGLLALGLALSSKVWTQWEGQRIMARAEESMKLGQWRDAEKNLIQAENKIPEDPEVRCHLATVEIAEGSWLEAAASLESAAKLNPYRKSTWTQLAMVYKKLNRPDLMEQTQEQSSRFLLRP